MTKKKKSTEKMMMFTYGILKYRYNLMEEGATVIIENSTVSGQEVFLYNNSFPITRKTENKNDVVYGTLFEMPKEVVLKQYDHIEGYNPNAPSTHNMYNREKVTVTTPSGEKIEAEMYYANPMHFQGWYNSRTKIPTGNYDDRHLVPSFRQTKR